MSSPKDTEAIIEEEEVFSERGEEENETIIETEEEFEQRGGAAAANGVGEVDPGEYYELTETVQSVLLFSRFPNCILPLILISVSLISRQNVRGLNRIGTSFKVRFRNMDEAADAEGVLQGIFNDILQRSAEAGLSND